eukprot:TRINITY_DN5418_c0_g1_i1.p1 TRINITY_DN5418_c0_g1~~TRINITY_DN5418_c0_g1_i1.p1  ORF type:complete len:710 (+),score=144.93 TRINITY_DN5418_c0_g1_i1:154-2283(+)
MKGTFVFFILFAFVCTTFATCDFNVGSLADLNSILAAQTWAPAVKTICFAPGDYTPSGVLSVTAPQTWLGAQANKDPTCGRRVDPPCARLQSARVLDTNKESVFNLVSQSLVEASADFTMNGFAVSSSNSFSNPSLLIIKNTGSTPQASLSFSYILVNGVAIASIYGGSFENNYFEWNSQSSITLMITISNAFSFQDNFVYNFPKFLSAITGSVTISRNTFVKNRGPLVVNGASVTDNFFLQNTFAVQDGVGSNIAGNSFLSNDYVYYASFSNLAPVTITNNCILDNSHMFFDSSSKVDISNSNFDGNYIGPHHFVSGGWNSPVDQYYKVNPAIAPVTVAAPAVCPRNFFTLNVIGNKPFSLGDTYNVYWSFKISSGFLKAGFDIAAINNTVITFSIYNGQNDPTQGSKQLSFTEALVFDHSGLALHEFSYTPKYDDFDRKPVHGVHNYYTLMAEVSTTYSMETHHYIAVADLVIYNQIPEICKDRTEPFVVPKSAQNNNGGVVTLNLSDLSCPLSPANWTITNIAQQAQYAPQLSVASPTSVQFTIDPTKSGNFSFTFEITSVQDSSIKHNVVQHVHVANTKPYAPNKNITFTSWAEYEGENILTLTGASDADGDTLTISKITPRTNGTSIDDHTVYYSKGFVVQVSTNGVINLFNPDLTGNSPAKGTAIDANTFNHHFGIHYQVDDGDRLHNADFGLLVFQKAAPTK